MRYEIRIGAGIVDDKDSYQEFLARFDWVLKAFNNWTIRSGIPCGAIGGLLFVCFLKYMDEFADELGLLINPRYSYSALADNDAKAALHDIEYYVSDVERQLNMQNGTIKTYGLLSDYTRRIDGQLVWDALRASLHYVGEITIRDNERIFLDALLRAAEGYRDRAAGLAMSSMELSKVMSALLDVQPGESVEDVAAGVGTLLAVSTVGVPARVQAQEIAADVAALNAMLMIMSGSRHYQMMCADSLGDTGTGHEGEYDKIVSDLPILKKLNTICPSDMDLPRMAHGVWSGESSAT